MSATLESTLNDVDLKHGRICLYVQDGEWYGAITHFHGHQTVGFKSNTGSGDGLYQNWHDSPSKALLDVLLKDKLITKELRNRYSEATKQSDIDAADEFEGIF